MTTASPLPGERPSRCLRFPNPLLPSLLSSSIPRAPSFHVGAQRSARSSGSGGNAIAEPSGWSGSSASRNFHHTSDNVGHTFLSRRHCIRSDKQFLFVTSNFRNNSSTFRILTSSVIASFQLFSENVFAVPCI